MPTLFKQRISPGRTLQARSRDLASWMQPSPVTTAVTSLYPAVHSRTLPQNLPQPLSDAPFSNGPPLKSASSQRVLDTDFAGAWPTRCAWQDSLPASARRLVDTDLAGAEIVGSFASGPAPKSVSSHRLLDTDVAGTVFAATFPRDPTQSLYPPGASWIQTWPALL